MSGVGVWITSILAVVIIGVVADLLLHGNRMHKFVKGVFGIITLFIIVAPVPTLIKNGFDFDNLFDIGDSIHINQDLLDAINARKIRLLEQGTEEFIATRGIEGVSIRITADVQGAEITVKQVNADLSNSTSSLDSSIDKQSFVAELLISALKVEIYQINVYG